MDVVLPKGFFFRSGDHVPHRTGAEASPLCLPCRNARRPYIDLDSVYAGLRSLI